MAASGSGGYGGPDFARIDNSLRNMAISYGAILSASQQIAASVNAWRMLERELTMANAAAGGTAAEFGKMEAAARSMALASTFSASQIANSFYSLASAGMTVTETLQAARGVMLLSLATMSDLGEASDVVSSTLQQFNLQASESYRVSNLFVASTNSSLSTLPKLAFALRQVGPIAAQVGLSIEQTVASLDMLFDVGLRGEQAGTALRNSIARIMDPVGNGAKILEVFGVNLFDDATGKTKEFLDVMKELAGLNLTNTQITQIFGVEATAGAIAMMNAVEGVNSALSKHQQEITNTDWAYRQSVQMMNTLDGELLVMQNNFNELRITIGKGVAPAIGQLAEIVEDVTEALKGLSAEQALGYVQLLLFAAGIGVAAKGLHTLFTGINNFKIAGTGVAAYLAKWTAANEALILSGERTRRQFNKNMLTMGQQAQAHKMMMGAIGGAVSATLGVLGLAAALGALAVAYVKAGRAKERARIESAGGNIVEGVAKATPALSADAQAIREAVTNEGGKAYRRDVKKLTSIEEQSGAFEMIRQYRVQAEMGERRIKELGKLRETFGQQGEKLREELSRTGAELLEAYGTGFFRVQAPTETMVAAANGDQALARKFITEQFTLYEQLAGQTDQERRVGLRKLGDNLVAAAKKTNATAQGEAAKQRDAFYKLAKDGSRATVEVATEALSQGAEAGFKALQEKESAAGAAFEAAEVIEKAISENMILTPEQFAALGARIASQQESIQGDVDNLKKRIAGLDTRLAEQIVGFIAQQGNLNKEQRKKLSEYFKTAQGAEQMKGMLADVKNGKAELHTLWEGISAELVKNKIATQEQVKRTADNLRAIPLITNAELVKLERSVKEEWLGLKESFARLVGNGPEADNFAREVAKLRRTSSREAAVEELLNILSNTDDAHSKQVAARLRADPFRLNWMTSLLEQAANGNAEAFEKVREAMTRQGMFEDKNGSMTRLLEYTRDKMVVARQQETNTRQKLLEDAKKDRGPSIKDDSLERYVKELLDLPSDQELYNTAQALRIEARYAISDYFNMPLEGVARAIEENQLDTIGKIADLRSKFQKIYQDSLAQGVSGAINNEAMIKAFSGSSLITAMTDGSATILGRTFTKEFLETTDGLEQYVRFVEDEFSKVVAGSPKAADRVAAAGRMLRGMTNEVVATLAEGSASANVLQIQFEEVQNDIREFMQNFDGERLIEQFEQSMQLGAAGNRKQLEIGMDIAIKAKTMRVILDTQTAIKELREKYEEAFRNIGVPVYVTAQGQMAFAKEVKAALGIVAQETATRTVAAVAKPGLQSNGIMESYRAPVSGGVNSRYGMRRHPITGQMRMHSGIDFDANLEDSVAASFSGRVVEPTRRRGYGKTVEIEHANGLRTFYAHLNSIAVKVGDTVIQGQRIGGAGTTGLSTGVHVHQEVLTRDGKRVDPRTIGNMKVGGVDNVDNSEIALNVQEKLLTVTEQVLQKQGQLAEQMLAEANAAYDRLIELRDLRVAFIEDVAHAETFRAAEARKARIEEYEATYGQLDQAYRDTAQDRTNGAQFAFDRANSGVDMAGMQRANLALKLAELDQEKVERLTEIRRQMVAAHANELEIADAVQMVNEEYALRAELLGTNVDFMREQLQLAEEFYERLAARDGSNEGDFLFGLRAAVLSFAAEVPTVFETVRETALTALNGIAEMGAALVTGSEQNMKQMVAGMLRSMSQLLAKMVIMYAMLQLIRAIPGGSALLAALDMGSNLGGGAAKAGITTGANELTGGFVRGKAFARGGIARGPQLALFGEGDHPEAYIPMEDKRTIPVRIDDNGMAYVPLPSGGTIPVNLDIGKKRKFARGGIMSNRGRADSVSFGMAEAASRFRGGGGPAMGGSFRNENHISVGVTIQGNAGRDDGEAIGAQVAKALDKLLTEREAESARRQMRNSQTVQAGYFNGGYG